MGVNKCFFHGRLWRDPSMRYTTSGKALTKFSIAVDSGFGDNKKTVSIKIETWGNLAEFCGEYLRQGTKIYVEGAYCCNEYEKDGVKTYNTYIKAQAVEILAKKKENAGNE